MIDNNLNASDVSTEELNPVKPNTFQDFRFACDRLKCLKDDFVSTAGKAKTNRAILDFTADNVELRATQDLLDDEVLLPIRMIKKNVRRAMPSYLESLVGSQDIVALKASNNPAVSVDILNTELTKIIRTNHWLRQHMINIQGLLAQGLSYIITEFDINVEGHVKNTRVKMEDLLIPKDLEDIQSAEAIAHRLNVTNSSLRKLVKSFGFNKQVASEIVKSELRDEQEESVRANSYNIYHLYFKQDGIIYHGWLAEPSGKVSAWLKSPEPLYLGRDDVELVTDEVTGLETQEFIPVEETEYPIDAFFKAFPESGRILDATGLAEDASPMQEAITILISNVVNASARAGNFYGSVDQLSEDDANTAPGQLESGLKAGTVFNRPIRSHSVQQPDLVSLQVAQWLENEDADENGQFSFLMQGRGDRKTAKEVQSAENQTSLASSQDLLVYHLSLHKVIQRAVRIILNRWRSGKIQLNNIPEDLKEAKLFIEPIAQKDALLKQQRLNQRRMDMALMSSTPAFNDFFADFLREAYPAHADKYIASIQQAGGANALQQQNQQLKTQLGDLAGIVEGALSSGYLDELTPEDRQKLNQMVQTIEGIVNEG